MVRRIKGITIELNGETRPLEKALADVNRRSAELQKELRDVERLLKFDPENVELLAQKQQLLNQQIENTTERLNRLRAAEQQVEQQFNLGQISEAQFRGFRREIQATEKRLESLQQELATISDKGALDNIKQSLQQVSQEAQNAQESAINLGDALAGVGAGLTIDAVVSKALEQSSLDTQIEISFDVPPESVESVKNAVKLVTSFIDDQEEALEGVRRQWALNADASDEANARLVKGAAAISKAYAQIDFSELIQEVNEISDALQISNDEALALTNALLKAGFPPEQLDIISEYGLQLRMAGYEAKEIQAIFAAGIKTKTWNIDNLLDGLKEGRIRLAEFGQEVPKAVRELLSGTEISARQMQEWGRAVAEGGEAGKQAMVEVAQALRGIDDETRRNALGVAVFGTMWEDQGEKILDTIINAKGQVVDLAANQQLLNQQVQALDSDPVVQLRQAFGELKEALEPVLEPIARFISWLAKWIKENPELAATITTVVGALIILAGIIKLIAGIVIPLIPIIVGVAKAFAAVNPMVWLVIIAILALIGIIYLLWKNWDRIKAKTIEVWESIRRNVSEKLDQVRGRVRSTWERIKSIFKSIDLVKIGKDIIRGLLDGISSLRDRVFRKAQEIADGIKSRIKSALGIASPSKVMIGFGRDTAEGFIIGLNSMMGEIRRVSGQMAGVMTAAPETASGPQAVQAAPNYTINISGVPPSALAMGREMIRQLRIYERLRG